jgi:hypothetical protein
MDQQQQSGFWQPTNDREEDAKDLRNACEHQFTTWLGNPYVQRCPCGEWYRTDVPGHG